MSPNPKSRALRAGSPPATSEFAAQRMGAPCIFKNPHLRIRVRYCQKIDYTFSLTYSCYSVPFSFLSCCPRHDSSLSTSIKKLSIEILKAVPISTISRLANYPANHARDGRTALKPPININTTAGITNRGTAFTREIF